MKLPVVPADEVATEKRKQEIAQLRDYYTQLHRVESVGFRIRRNNRDDCKEWISAQIGLWAATPQSLPRKYRSFSREALGLRWVRPTVISVAETSPAEVAGIRNGDELISFNGERIPVTGTLGWMGNYLKQNGEHPVHVVFKRAGEDQTLVVYPVLACAIPIVLDINPVPNAFTDFRKIIIQTGILRLTRTDDDLATIVGHELAHVTMGHYKKQLINESLGGIGGAMVDSGFLLGGIYTHAAFTDYLGRVGARMFSVGFEREADYVGAYYATRAGYEIGGTEEMWRAVSLENPKSIRLATTHPITPVRYVQMRKVTEEIADKRKHGLPLEPNMKVAGAEPPAVEPATIYENE